jgi:hypothetical protein
MRVRPLAVAFAASLFALWAMPASAKLLIAIDKSSQRMTVSQDGARIYTWPVSTGISRYDTPAGMFTPFRMEKDHFSREWDDAPMPNSIFFTTRGHAIHGTNHTSIGRPASHGCVRLSVEHSAMLFDLVKREGMQNTRVELYGDIPVGAPQVSRRAPSYQPGYQQGYAQPRYEQRDQDDDDVTASVPQRGVLPSYQRQERPVYRDRYPNDPPVYSEREAPYRGPPPFFPFPGQRWD